MDHHLIGLINEQHLFLVHLYFASNASHLTKVSKFVLTTRI